MMTPNLELIRPTDVNTAFEMAVQMIAPKKNQYEVGVRIEKQGSDAFYGSVVGFQELSASAPTVEQILETMRTRVRQTLSNGVRIVSQPGYKARSEDERWILVTLDDAASPQTIFDLAETETTLSPEGCMSFHKAIESGSARPKIFGRSLPTK